MQLFIMRKRGLILPGCGGTSTMSPSLILNQPGQWGWNFHTIRGGVDSRDVRFRLRVVGFIDVRNYFLSGDGA